MTLPDIVFPVRFGDHNPELQYALRSLSNVPHGTVWIAGYLPGWVENCQYIPTVQTSNKHRNSFCNLVLASEHPDVSEDFVLWNDDMYLLKPLEKIPVLHRGTISDYLKANKVSGNSSYMIGNRATLKLLNQNGHLDPLSYELHVPLPMTKSGIAAACRAIEAGKIAANIAIQLRSVYGNLAQIGGIEAKDVKFFSTKSAPPLNTFASTSDSVWTRHPNAIKIREILSTPSPYEKDI